MRPVWKGEDEFGRDNLGRWFRWGSLHPVLG